MVNSVYIHIPFCSDICSYCAFSKVFYDEKLVDRYLYSLNNEIKEKYQNDKINTLYIGGGTPSCLSLSQLKKLFDIIKIFRLSDNLEFTFECNFDISKEKLLLLKENGVNRLSFGLETINRKFYKDINRSNSKNNIIDKIKLSRSLGFNNINIDLMYGFSNETLDDLDKDINFILSLDVEHISTYSLMIEEHTKLYINKYKTVDDELDSRMYYNVHNKLIHNNYSHYEVSNYAKYNYQSKHNLNYWKNKKYYGFGLAASGYLENRYTNTKNINKYLNGSYIDNIEELDKNDIMTYEMILGLRTIDGVSIDEFRDKYNVNLLDYYDIDDLINNKYLCISNNCIYIPHDKWYVMNNILLRFVR